MAVFALVLGATAQCLVAYYATLALQSQRAVALSHCQDTLARMRLVRDANPDAFPGAVLDQWPDGEPVDGVVSLRGEVVTAVYDAPLGNPLGVSVTSQWQDLRGRPARVSLSTRLTDR